MRRPLEAIRTAAAARLLSPVSIALGAKHLTLLAPGPSRAAGTVARTELVTENWAGEHCWPGLQEALVRVRDACPGRRRLRVVLLPELTEERQLPPLPLSRSRTRLVVLENAGRFFVRAAVPLALCSPIRTPHGNRVVMSAVPEPLLRAVRAAAAAAGWRIAEVVPAVACWARPGRRRSGRNSARAICFAPRSRGLLIEDDADGLRVSPAPGGEDGARLETWLRSRGAGEWERMGPGDAELSAIRNGGSVIGFRSHADLTSRLARRAASVRLAATAGLLLLLSAQALRLVDGSQELRRLRESRAAKRQAVEEVLTLRSRNAALLARYEAVLSLLADRPRPLLPLHQISGGLGAPLFLRRVTIDADSARVLVSGGTVTLLRDALTRAGCPHTIDDDPVPAAEAAESREPPALAVRLAVPCRTPPVSQPGSGDP